ncbi:MAG: bifunctional enoyl-CoA hydratase/phosphate acetyltransferase [bacterium]
MAEIKTLQEIANHAIAMPLQKVAVVCGDDPDTIEAIEQACKDNIVQPIMVGNKKATIELAKSLNIDHSLFEYVDETGRSQAARTAVKLIKEGEAQLIMKGFVGTDDYARAILDKESGLMKSKSIMSHVTIVEVESYPKLLFASDVAIIPQPDLNQKALMISYATEMANLMGIKTPKVAILSATEKVKEKMQSTVDAALLSKMAERGQIKNCIVDGPLAMDIAINPKCLAGKKIKSPVEAQADILIFPNIEAGNIFYKSMIHLGKAKIAAIITGAQCPGVLVSRTDSEEIKYYSIALAVYVSAKRLELGND